MPLDEFAGRIDELVRRVKAGERQESAGELAVPGERSHRRAANLTRPVQVPLNAVAWNTLAEVWGRSASRCRVERQLRLP